MHEFSRNELLLGTAATETLKNATVAVYGVGGVGSYAVEALARAGVGHLVLFDADTVSLTNINRQLVALHSTIGQKKVDVAKARILDINPACSVTTHDVFLMPENMAEYPVNGYDYIVDAIDTVSAKLALIEAAHAANVPIICAMGCGNKLHADAFTVTDLFKTNTDALARVLRRELRLRGIKKQKVVFSTEVPLTPHPAEQGDTVGQGRRQTPGSVSWVPGAAGLILAGEVVKDLLQIK